MLDAERVRLMLEQMDPDARAAAIQGLGQLADGAQRIMHSKRLYGLREAP